MDLQMTNTAIRLSGLLLMGGALLLGVAIVMLSFKPVINQLFSPRISWLLLLASILMLLSLPGMYAKQASSAGWLGLIGYALVEAGMLLIVIVAAMPLVYPSIREPMGESLVAFGLGIALTLGLLLTGIANHAGRSLSALVRNTAAGRDSRLFLCILHCGISTTCRRAVRERNL